MSDVNTEAMLTALSGKVNSLSSELLDPAQFDCTAGKGTLLADAQAAVKQRKRQVATDKVADLLLKLEDIKAQCRRKLREVKTACDKDLKEAAKLEKQIEAIVNAIDFRLNQDYAPAQGEPDAS